MDELIKRIEILRERLGKTRSAVRIDDKRSRIAELQALMAQPDFWSDTKNASTLSQECADLEHSVTFWSSAEKRVDDLLSVARADDVDREVALREELEKELGTLEESVDEEELRVWLNEPYDDSPAIITIYSGAGGVDAQDWAEMLERMYLRFCESRDFKTEIIQRTPGQEAGIKNVTIRADGAYAYGYLKPEAGVHRLVRLSPYDADQARHTSFAMVEVLPELDQPKTITVPDGDIRVDVFRSSGHGGQSVNTTDSAVRLTHLPTGISVSCQNERSQMQNKEQAWRILLGKLERYYTAQKEEERQLLRGELTENAWGNQIRSYVLHPYKMVKDLRSRHESTDPNAVLDGGLMPFIEAELRHRAAVS